ncbi:MAG: DUF2851 family protein [Bacteroidia bacterium]|nr:DUF2851 family protein [Bacteroidia bacterium]MDW8302966.1 DUF2851 family protein [Bacteroidia bacterium]
MSQISETLLAYIWKHKKFDTSQLLTEDNQPIEIVEVGRTNSAEGPDFLDARIRINGYLWAGSVEIDVLQQNWELHKHHLNPKYNNVILHVIFEENHKIPPIYRADNTFVPTLNLKKYVRDSLIQTYQQMQKSYSFIPCEKLFDPSYLPNDHNEVLLMERLIEKSQQFYQQHQSYLDWQNTFWIAFIQGFGYEKNVESFKEIAQKLPFKLILKYQRNLEDLEALLFGVAGLLEHQKIQEPYYLNLKQKWELLKNKHTLSAISLYPLQWGGIRPANFPTIRLMIIAKILHRHSHLIQNGFQIKSVKEWHETFEKISTSHTFWDTHYTFEKISQPKVKTLGKTAINIMLINTILPVQFLYYQYHHPFKAQSILNLYREIEPEENHITQKWKNLGVSLKQAHDTQVWIHLYKNYCEHKKCLSCPIGQNILS